MIDTSAAWALHDAVSVRPEPFGALLYHFGNRKLSFLKDRTLLDVVRALDEQPSIDAALSAAGVSDADRPRYVKALESLVASDIVVRRDPVPTGSATHDGAAHGDAKETA